MDVSIQSHNKKIGELSYRSLPMYRLLCEQLGLQTQWDRKKKILSVIPNFKERKIYFASTENNDVLTSIFADLKMFLSDAEIEFNQLDSNANPPNNSEIFLQTIWNTNSSIQSPRFYIRFHPRYKEKLWAQAFYKEMRLNGFPVSIKANRKRSPVSTLELHCQLPENMENEKKLQESIVLLFVSSILRGMTKGNLLKLLPYLSHEHLSLLLFNDKNEKNLHYTEITAQKSEKAKTSLDSVIPDLRAEVYFDHQVVIPSSEDDHYLVVGSMYIKNIGNQNLTNPHICLRITPTEGIQLKGQVIPPNLVDTVGVQSSNGESAVGWRYLEEDWLKKAKEQGVYWICPIQPLVIPTEQIEKFSNFQLSIPKTEVNKTFTMQGMVYFKELDLQVPSNNRITLSF